MQEIKKIAVKIGLFAIVLVALNYVYTQFFFQADIKEYAQVYELIEALPDSTEIVYIGESSNQTYSPYDVDKRKISEFLADYFPSIGVSDITKPASHAGTYYTLLTAIPESKKVKTVVVTLNMRSFNAQWIYSDAETSLQKETLLLKRFPALYNRFLLSFKGYDTTPEDEREAQMKNMWASEPIQMPRKFDFTNLKDWDHWLVHEGMKDENGNIDIPRKNLASHYLKAYGLQINFETNPRIKDFNNIVTLAKERGWKLVFNLMAENIDKAHELVGSDLTYLMRENRDKLVDYYLKKGVTVVDNLESVRDIDFIDQDWTTEHYTERGRRAVAKNVAVGLKKFYKHEFKEPAHSNLQPTKFYNDCEDQRNVWGNMQTVTTERFFEGKKSSKVGGVDKYSMTMTYPMDQMVDSVKNKVVVDLMLYRSDKSAQPTLVVGISKGDASLKWLGINLYEDDNQVGKWQKIHYDLNFQSYLPEADLIKVFVLNNENAPCYVDNFSVEFK